MSQVAVEVSGQVKRARTSVRELRREKEKRKKRQQGRQPESDKPGALKMNGKWMLYLDLVNANPDLKRQARGRLFAAFKNYFTGGFTGRFLKRTNPPGYNKNRRIHLNHKLTTERGGTPAPFKTTFPTQVHPPVGFFLVLPEEEYCSRITFFCRVFHTHHQNIGCICDLK